MNKVIVDQMLGSLAKWLRLLGVDTYFTKNTIMDEALLQIAKSENRILITRDKELIIRATKHKIPNISIHSTDIDKQLRTVLNQLPIDTRKLFSRCTICNTPVHSVEKMSVKQFIPKKILSKKDEYWYCPTCNKYYWQGSHYEKIREKISTILDS